MNYSQKKSGKMPSKLVGGIAKALFVMVAALWFCDGVCLPANDATVSAGIVMVDAYEKASDNGIVVPEDKSDEESFINPTEGVLTSDFGLRDGKNHDGIDIGAQTGTGIYAAASGVVTYAGVVDGYGNYIIIDHKNGYETAYAHCDEILVCEGDSVEQSQLIAYMGSTGRSTGPHLHFEVKHYGKFCDPLDFVIY